MAPNKNVKIAVNRRPKYWVPNHPKQLAGISTKESMKKFRKYRFGRISILITTHPYVTLEAILKEKNEYVQLVRYCQHINKCIVKINCINF